MSVGPKLRDGLLAYADKDSIAIGEFADELLIAMGYPPKVAASIIDRLDRRGWIEYGVSARSGWLTDEGRAALSQARREDEG